MLETKETPMASKKEHAAWVVGATIIAFAVEGWQGTFGHNLAHTIGIPASGMAVIGGVAFGYVYSLFFEGAEKPKKPEPKTEAAPRPKVRQRKK